MKNAASYVGKVTRIASATDVEVMFDSVPYLCSVKNNEIEELTVTTMPQKPDMVNHPPHYCQEDGLECIEVMQLLFGKKAVIDYCRCNIFKYRFRAEHKNGAEDIRKAQWYENKLNELLEAGFTVHGKE